MNTRKQIFVMAALLLISLVALGIYGASLPSREKGSLLDFEEKTAERGSILFAQNCRLCHGDLAEGGSLGGRLAAAPALNRSDLQGFIEVKFKQGTRDVTVTLNADVTATATSIQPTDVSKYKAGQIILVDAERMEITAIEGNTLTVARAAERTAASAHTKDTPVLVKDTQTVKDKETLIRNTITCGRVGTAMPPWASSQGGPLSDEQIRQLTVLIMTARWDLVEHEVDHLDAIASKLLDPLSADATQIRVSDVTKLTEKEAIRIGEERLRVVSVPKVDPNEKDKSGLIRIERGILGTTPLDHTVDAAVFKFPETAAPSINQQACGQIARPVAPSRPPATVTSFEGQTVNITARGVAFDKRELVVKAGTKVRVRFDNQDVATEHNFAAYNSSTNLSPIASGSIGATFPGPGQDDVIFDPPAAGTYFFRCDVHPTTMTGDFIVEP